MRGTLSFGSHAGVRRSLHVVIPSAAVFLLAVAAASAQDATKPGDYRSERVLLHTDLPADKAKELLAELEKVIDFAAEYWKRPSRGLVECYVVADLANWQGPALEDGGRKAIEAGGGVTLTRTLRSGGAFQARATVYASAKGTSAKHEAVHAYCRQAFGEVGPLWYAEGMAEIGQYFTGQQAGVDCEAGLARHLRSTTPPSLDDVVTMKQRTAEGYAWAWALCHLLANHPRYADRFRQYGINVVTGKKAEFRTVFSKDAAGAKETDRIDFERRLMLTNLERGYRVDLCAWDWDAPFGPPQPGSTRELTVEAARGWQATNLEVKSGDRVPFRSAGAWRLKKDGGMLTADGDGRGAGRLIGVLLTRDESSGDFRLGEPFDLGRQGTWTARSAGQLYVRCRDAWHELADNEGSLTLTLPQSTAAPAVIAAKKPKAATTSTAASPKKPLAEEQAAGKLRVAKLLMQGKPELAKEQLAALIQQFPGTPAAKEAAELLKQLGD
jgi:hypothetical protein